MSKFIKLSSLILNIAHINKIEIKKDLYRISLLTNSSSGFYIICTGFMHPLTFEYDICAQKHPIDYKIMSDYINKFELDKAQIV